jgi:hypothetical protein
MQVCQQLKLALETTLCNAKFHRLWMYVWLAAVLQAEAVSDVENIWNCKKSVAKTLLMHYMWDKERLLSEEHQQQQHTRAALCMCGNQRQVQQLYRNIQRYT